MAKLLLSLIAVSFIFSSGRTQTVKFGSVIPKDSPWEQGLNEYIAFAQQASGGELKFRTFVGGQLGGEVEMLKSIAMGTLEGGAFSIAAIAEALNIPQLQVFELPFLFETNEEADFVMDAMFGTMAPLMEKKGLKLVMWGTNGWRNLGSRNKPIVSPEHLKGLKMRSQESGVYILFYKSLKATPVPIPTPDVLVALKSGMVDGFDQTPIFSVSAGWITTIKYYTLSRHIYQPGAVVISKRFYDKLSAKSKQAILGGNERKRLQQNTNKYVREADDDILLNMQNDFGVKPAELTPQQKDAFRAATRPVYAQMEAKVGKVNIQRVQQLVQEYKKIKK